AAAGGDNPLEALLAREAEQHPGIVRIVLDDQQHLIVGPDGVTIVLDHLLPREHRPGNPRRRVGRGFGLRSRLDVAKRKVQRERAALAGGALQPDLAAEQRGELARDRQAETGAAVLAAGAGVRLLKRLEDETLLLRRDS